uniref:Uncharacterized protein n=1 Tax=Anguilla anguilla TaxID=7936 RepID=A0A0E9U0M1_ANGAN
MLSRPVGGH